MNIPPHWAKASSFAARPDGTSIGLTAWGWSLSDPGEAQRNADERLAKMADRVARGEDLPSKYPYGANALREQILEEIRDGDEVRALITRNGYGSVVMNAPEAMFIDIDVPEPSLGQRLKSLWSRGAARDEEAVQKITAALSQASRSTFRLYRTAAGFRLLSTDRTWVAGSPETERIMSAVGADPAYMLLCKAQKTFRARLTPKPWRCGIGPPPGSHPRDAAQSADFKRWLENYESEAAERSVCRFVTQVGSGRTCASVEQVLAYHDRTARANDALPLA